MKEKENQICTDCKNTKCEQIQQGVVIRRVVMQSPEILVGDINKCRLKKKKEDK